jgi:hypothetical protein
MITHSEPGYGTRIACHDALERPFDLHHFAGHDLLTLTPTHTHDRRLRFTPHAAARLATVLDHFARHHQLPTAPVTAHDWSI